ncbi:hypothetical protein BD410DRAFT_789813 [Rickenella mellea]|uniref:Uncharacterized protein n=1 Tax=Rickenella mellea TaxID=50990 RepID=A0A4Y7Q157_9AGAM|nr:hypothetical protein BD410DRAFT_789813 [Rickenella mellea]
MLGLRYGHNRDSKDHATRELSACGVFTDCWCWQNEPAILSRKVGITAKTYEPR